MGLLLLVLYMNDTVETILQQKRMHAYTYAILTCAHTPVLFASAHAKTRSASLTDTYSGWLYMLLLHSQSLIWVGIGQLSCFPALMVRSLFDKTLGRKGIFFLTRQGRTSRHCRVRSYLT